jgi:hypothetical protein
LQEITETGILSKMLFSSVSVSNQIMPATPTAQTKFERKMFKH